MSRYVVTELEGWPILPGARPQTPHAGLSVHVLDTAWNQRVVGTFSSERQGGRPGPTRAQRRERARAQAAALAALLNQEDALVRVRARGG